MGLEDFSRGKKIFYTIITIVGAALFMVTGAMLAMADSCGQEAPSKVRGTIAGEEVNKREFDARRQVLRSFTSPRVPLLQSKENELKLVKDGLTEGDHSAPLFHIWPVLKDQNVYLFARAAQIAEEAGITRPTEHEANIFYFTQNNLTRSDPDQEVIWGSELDNYFDKHFGLDRKSFLGAVAEYMMIFEYVRVIDADYQSSPIEAVELYKERVSKLQAQVYSVESEDFRAEAEALLEARIKEADAMRAASQLAGSGATSVLSPLEEVELFPNPYEKRELLEQRKTRVQVLYQTYDDLAASLKSDLQDETKRNFYENEKGKSFRVLPKDQKPGRIDARFEMIANRMKSLGQEVNESEIRDTLNNFYHYYERESEIRDLLARSVSIQLLTSAMSDVQRELDKDFKDQTLQIQEIATAESRKTEEAGATIRFLSTLESEFQRLKSDPINKLVAALEKQNKSTADLSIQRKNLVQSLKGAFSHSYGSSAYDLVTKMRKAVDVKRFETELADVRLELSDVKRAIEARKDMEAYKEAWAFINAATSIEFRVTGAERVLEAAKNFESKIEAFNNKLETMLAEIHLRITALGSEQVEIPTIVNYAESLLADYPAMIEEHSKGLLDEELLAALESEQSVADLESSRKQSLKNYLVLRENEVNLDIYAKKKKEFPWAGFKRGADGNREPISIMLKFDSLKLRSLQELKEQGSDWAWISDVSSASSFFLSESNGHGSLSEIIDRSGVGLYLFRVVDRQPESRLAANEEANQAKIREFAIRRIMRELAFAEINRVRNEAIDSGNAKEFFNAKSVADASSVQTLPWFSMGDPLGAKTADGEMKSLLQLIPEPANDQNKRRDGSNAQRVNSGSVAADAFYTPLRSLSADAPVSKPFYQGIVGGEFDSEITKERYSIAWITAHKVNQDALPATENDLRNSQSPQIIQQTRKAADERIIQLTTPAKLLEGIEIEFDPVPYKDQEEDSKEEEN